MTSTPERRHDEIGAFFAANATRLHNIVRAAARVAEHVIEEACQTAWTILLRRPDVTLDQRGLSWLAPSRSATPGATPRTPARSPPAAFRGTGHDGEPGEPAHPDQRSAEDRALARIEHDERFAAVATLKLAEHFNVPLERIAARRARARRRTTSSTSRATSIAHSRPNAATFLTRA